MGGLGTSTSHFGFPGTLQLQIRVTILLKLVGRKLERPLPLLDGLATFPLIIQRNLKEFIYLYVLQNKQSKKSNALIGGVLDFL